MEPDSTPQTNPQPAPAAPNAAVETAQLPLPDTWPGAFGAYKYSKQAVMVNIGPIITWGLLGIIVNGVLEAVLKRPGQLLGFLIGSLFTAVLVVLYIAGARGQKVSASDAFSKGMNVWLKMIGLNILVGLSMVASFLLLIVPFFFVLPRLTLAQYFLIDRNMGIVDAYKASWNETKGNAATIWGIIGVGILFGILCFVLIGIYFSIMYSAVFGVLFEVLNRHPKSQQPAAINQAAAGPPTATPV